MEQKVDNYQYDMALLTQYIPDQSLRHDFLVYTQYVGSREQQSLSNVETIFVALFFARSERYLYSILVLKM